jgi:chemotaxis protein MotB
VADKRPIIVIKKVSGHGGHHGGAWKVAYADFVTAMMALFIVLWLLSSSVKVKKAVAGYFNDPKSSQKETGSDKMGDAESVTLDKTNIQKLKEQIQKAIKEQNNLEKLAKQIEITITPEGLRIELIEDKSGTFFQSGSAKLSENGQELLGMLAKQLKPLPNKLLLEGHTDAAPYPSDNGYTNWELSADRANAARRLLQSDGVGKDQISQVRGYADQMLRVKNDPMDPTNRRISLIVQWVEVPVAPGEAGEKSEQGKPTESKPGDTKPGDTKPGDTKPGETKPGETKPGEAGPAETKPAAGSSPQAARQAAKPEAGKPGAATPAASPSSSSLIDRLKSIVSKNKPPKK